MEDHINLVLSKISTGIVMMKYAKKALPTNFLKMLYLGLEPHFRYCCSVWGSCQVTTRQILDKLQTEPYEF